MKKIAILCLSLLSCASIFAGTKWVEVSHNANIIVYADEVSFEEIKTTTQLPAIIMNYKISTNPDHTGIIFTTVEECKKMTGVATLGYYLPPPTAKTVADISPFYKGEFKAINTIAFNTQEKTGLNPLVARACDLIPSWKNLVYKAENKYAKALYKLAGLYWGGAYYEQTTVEKDETKAFSLYEKSAWLGNTDAQYMLGQIYEHGWSQPQNTGLAIAWYEKASNQGDMLSKVALANFYRSGEGINKDIVKADKLIEEVKASDDLNAIYQIPKIESYDKPTPLDLETILIFLVLGGGLIYLLAGKLLAEFVAFIFSLFS